MMTDEIMGQVPAGKYLHYHSPGPAKPGWFKYAWFVPYFELCDMRSVIAQVPDP